MIEYVLNLNDARAVLETVGGKGASLARLSGAGFPVPGGFHVTTAAYQKFVGYGNLQAQILDILMQTNPGQTTALDGASTRIQALFLQAAMPADIAEEIRQAYLRLPGPDPVVAVRSSATAEDLPGLSFAGQQETYLNIHGTASVLQAVQRCWASLWTARAIAYRIQHSIDQEALSLAVVVQTLVPSEASGVMFTANPINGQRGELMITAAWGLGESIVGGSVNPDTLVVEKASGRVLKHEIANKQVRTVLLERGTSEQPLPDDMCQAPVLSKDEALELATLGMRIEQLYGMPMDIEWALADGNFAIVQARPITALPEPEAPVPSEWKLPDPNGKYGRGSITEQMPEPLTPLFSSLAGPIIDQATRQLFASFMGLKGIPTHMFVTINEYAYLNVKFPLLWMLRMIVYSLVNMNRMLGQAPARWQAAHQHYEGVIHRWQVRPLAELSAAELLTAVRQLTQESVDMYTVLQSGVIPAASSSEITFTQAYNRLLKRRGDPSAETFVMGLENQAVRSEKGLYDLALWARQDPGLVNHLAGTAAGELARELEGAAAPSGVESKIWAEWQARFQAYLGQFGHSTYDMDFSKAVAADDPAPLMETLRLYLLGKAHSPYERVQTIAARRESAMQVMLKRLHGPGLWVFRKSLKSAQKNAPLREDGLADLGLGYPLLRRMLREFGRRLVQAGAIAQPEDVYWLLADEVDSAAVALDQKQALPSRREAVSQRKAAWRARRRLTPPLALPPGAKLMGMSAEKFTPARPSENNAYTITGFGASQGKVTATARVLRGPEDFDQLQPGDILVAPITTPAWTPLFAMASAIVTDIGGPLSHSSIVAREYGLPAVLGTNEATRRIRSGQTITVDGGAGVVTLSNGDDLLK